MNGTYSDASATANQAVLQIDRSGTEASPIRYTAFPGHSPKIMPAANVWQAVTVLGAAYIAIDSLEIEGNSASLTLDAALASQDGTNPVFNANGLFIKDGLDGAHAHHIIVQSCHVHHWPGGGIGTKNADYLTFENNTVNSNAWYSVYANSGISILTPRDADQSTGYRNVVQQNLTYDNESYIPSKAAKKITDGNGIIIDSTTEQFTLTGQHYLGRTLVTNNISFSNGGSGMHSFASEHVDVVNNTVYDNSRSPALTYAGLYASASNDCNLINNVVYVRTGEPTNVIDKNTKVRYDYNVYFNGLAPQSVGPNDIIGDPLFWAASDTAGASGFRVRPASPAVNSGTSELAPAVDFRGIPRPLHGAVDRGAFESIL
ncbi:right-handed parallel beta-helix repeat-containing protein [Subtercola boreus]|nr:right-handed parallel beta-helix repeat-containing protein [Subtercola boreus]